MAWYLCFDNLQMSSFPMPQDEYAKIAAYYLSVTPYCVLGTISPDLEPWSTPVYFSTAPDLQILWVSAVDARHSFNIQHHPLIAASFFDSDTPFGKAQGLYVTGTARILSVSELDWGCKTFYSRRFPNRVDFDHRARKPVEFLELSPRRMYACTLEHAWILDPKGDPIYGRLVDRRVEVDLKAFRGAYLPPHQPPEDRETDLSR